MLAAGIGLVAAARWAGPVAASPGAADATAPAKLRVGGTLRIAAPGAFQPTDSIDPSLAFSTDTWHIQYSTGLKLLNYPETAAPRGSRLLPEAVSRYSASPDGRTYTFRIRGGQRFSDGRPVTARNFAYAINRVLDKELQSPGFQFVTDPNGANIVGAQAVRDGKAASASGVRAQGNKLVIRLTRRDGSFLAKISMPFFQAISTRLPRSKPINAVRDRNDLPSAGPYYVSSRDPGRLTVLRRNPYYRGPRARNLDAVVIRWVGQVEQAHLQVLRGQMDWSWGIPAPVTAQLGRRYGVNRSAPDGVNVGRFLVKPTNCVRYMALNTQHPLFRNNARLRRGLNFAVNRKAMTDLGGAYSSIPHDQILPIGFPGYQDAKLYPTRPNLAVARQLARGATRGGRAPYYYFADPPGPTRMEIVRASLRQIGIEIEPKAFRGFDLFEAASRRGSNHAIAEAGWCQDYPDPYDFINILLYGKTIQAEHNLNIAYFNHPAYNRRMERAARLVGQARLRTYGRLDVDIMRHQAPWAVTAVGTVRFFLGERIDPRSFVYHPVYENPPLNTLALKRS